MRPEVKGVGIGKDPVGEPGAAQVEHRKEQRARDGEERHRFGKAVDRRAPLLAKEKENRRDQRAGMANPDPPDEVGNIKTPAHRLVDPPNANAAQKELTHGKEKDHKQHKTNRQPHKPGFGRHPRQDDSRNLLCDRPKAMARSDKLS